MYKYTNIIALSSTSLISSSSDVPFSNGHYSVESVNDHDHEYYYYHVFEVSSSSDSNRTFHNIDSSSITFDPVSAGLKNCILNNSVNDSFLVFSKKQLFNSSQTSIKLYGCYS